MRFGKGRRELVRSRGAGAGHEKKVASRSLQLVVVFHARNARNRPRKPASRKWELPNGGRKEQGNPVNELTTAEIERTLVAAKQREVKDKEPEDKESVEHGPASSEQLPPDGDEGLMLSIEKEKSSESASRKRRLTRLSSSSVALVNDRRFGPVDRPAWLFQPGSSEEGDMLPTATTAGKPTT